MADFQWSRAILLNQFFVCCVKRYAEEVQKVPLHTAHGTQRCAQWSPSRSCTTGSYQEQVHFEPEARAFFEPAVLWWTKKHGAGVYGVTVCRYMSEPFCNLEQKLENLVSYWEALLLSLTWQHYGGSRKEIEEHCWLLKRKQDTGVGSWMEDEGLI